MKRIILGLSLLLMLVQNGFAKTDTEFDKEIANETDKVWKQIRKCDKAAINHPNDADVDICLKVIPLKQERGDFSNSSFAITYSNIGVLYDNSEKNYIKAYEYFMKAAKLGNTKAQKNLDILCRKHSWVCK